MFLKQNNKLKNLIWADNRMQVKGINLALQGIAATYVIAGIWKLHVSGIDWVIDIPNISIQCVKTGMQKYLNYLDISKKEYGFEMAYKIIKSPNFFRFVMGLGLLAEIFAFILLLNRKIRFIMGIILLTMHISISYYMQLNFTLHKYILYILVINVPFLLSYPLTFIFEKIKNLYIKKQIKTK